MHVVRASHTRACSDNGSGAEVEHTKFALHGPNSGDPIKELKKKRCAIAFVAMKAKGIVITVPSTILTISPLAYGTPVSQAASYGIRTHDLPLTKGVLCQLSDRGGG